MIVLCSTNTNPRRSREKREAMSNVNSSERPVEVVSRKRGIGFAWAAEKADPVVEPEILIQTSECTCCGFAPEAPEGSWKALHDLRRHLRVAHIGTARVRILRGGSRVGDDAYATVRNGWAEAIVAHLPGGRLELLAPGDADRFAVWASLPAGKLTTVEEQYLAVVRKLAA